MALLSHGGSVSRLTGPSASTRRRASASATFGGRQRRQPVEHLRSRVLEADERRRVGAHPAATNLNARRRARAHTERPPITPRTPSAAEVNSQKGLG